MWSPSVTVVAVVAAAASNRPVVTTCGTRVARAVFTVSPQSPTASSAVAFIWCLAAYMSSRPRRRRRRRPDADTSSSRRPRHERRVPSTAIAPIAYPLCTDTRALPITGLSIRPPRSRTRPAICSPALSRRTTRPRSLTTTPYPWPWSCPCLCPCLPFAATRRLRRHRCCCNSMRRRRHLRCLRTTHKCCTKDEGILSTVTKVLSHLTLSVSLKLENEKKIETL